MAGVKYTPAPEVEEMAEQLIKKYHGHLRHPDVRIEYLFQDKTTRKGGKAVWATARKVSGLAAFLADPEYATRDDDDAAESLFVITVSRPIWDTIKPIQREALIDHELCHCYAGEVEDKHGEVTLKLSILEHDLTEFNAVYERYGDWSRDIKNFVAAGERYQGTLEFDAPAEALSEVTITYGDKTVSLGTRQRERLLEQGATPGAVQ